MFHLKAVQCPGLHHRESTELPPKLYGLGMVQSFTSVFITPKTA
jgi:hypothetical protein